MTIAIIVVILFLGFLFLRDKNDEAKKVKQDGGLEQKYGILIYHFLSIPNMKVKSRRPTSITLAVTDRFVETKFIISHGFDNVSVSWFHISNRFGLHELHWKFPERMAQGTMINLIEDELKNYERKLLNSS